MHQSFTGALVKCLFFDNFPMLADSFSVLSVHCVAQVSAARFLYNCPALRGGFLRQHCLLVLLTYLSVLRHAHRLHFRAILTLNGSNDVLLQQSWRCDVASL